MSTTPTVRTGTIEPDTIDSDASRRVRNRDVLVTASLVIVIVVGLIVARTVRSDRAPEPDPASVIEAYIAAFNERDIDAMMTQFAADAQLLGHPFATEAVGAAAIRDVQVEDLANAAPTDAIRLLDLDVAGDVVTWNQVYENRQGEFWCAGGHRAVVVDDAIARWEFSGDPRRCS